MKKSSLSNLLKRIFSILIFIYLCNVGFQIKNNMNHYSTGDWIIAICIYAILITISVKLLKSSFKHSEKSKVDTSTSAKNDTTPNTATAVSEPQPKVTQADKLEIKTERIDPDRNTHKLKGSALSYLDSKSLDFWNGKRTNYEVPSYYSENLFGQNTMATLDKFLTKGYLKVSGVDKNMSLCTVQDLKAVLAEHELKTSGKKQELIQRLLENLSTDELEELFPVGVYQLTEKGAKELEKYSLYKANDYYGLGFPYYRLMKEKTSTPDSSDEDILIRLLSRDIQDCYKNRNISSYESLILKAAYFMYSLQNYEKAFECFVLSYFIFYMEADRANAPAELIKNYGLALNIDKCGKALGYSLNEFEKNIRGTIYKDNPFGMGSAQNANKVIESINSSLSIE